MVKLEGRLEKARIVRASDVGKLAFGVLSNSDYKNLFAIMLDKVNPKEIKNIIEDFKSRDLYKSILFEASGNINSTRLMEYCDCGVDVISMGCITNSTRALDMSLEIR